VRVANMQKQRVASEDWFIFFDFDDFETAREKHPELFDWIDQPEQYISHFLHEQNHKQSSKIDLNLFSSYHEQVMDLLTGFKSELDALASNFDKNLDDS
jgi:hypothetical protein